MNNPKELENLFGNKTLEPKQRFVRSLGKQLDGRPKTIWPKIWIGVGGGVALALVLVFATFWQPSHQPAIARTVLVRELFKSAAADSLPKPTGATFWQVTGTQVNGPQFQACTHYTGPDYGPSHDLFFNDGLQSAWFSLGGWPNAQPLMRYSSEKDVPAYNADVFSGSDSSKVREMLVAATITDAQGNPLPKDATTTKKDTGTYDIYAEVSTPKSDYKDYIEGCSELAMRITIDATTGLYKEISIYNKTVSADNLSYMLKQDVQTSSVNFEQALPVLQKAGFDLETAKTEFLSMAYVREVNTEAGFEFSYIEPVLGKSHLTVEKDSAGTITGYTYTYAKWPNVSTTIRTKASKEAPQTIEDFRAEAKVKGWKITSDPSSPEFMAQQEAEAKAKGLRPPIGGINDDSHVPGCKAGDTSTGITARDDKMQYLLFVQTCGSFPSIYTSYPLSAIQHYIDHYDNDAMRDSFPIAGFGRFTPGGEPQLMH